MIFNVHPVSSLKGKVSLPASKSYSIRAFMIAACGGTSTISNMSDCDDALVAIEVAKSLGAKVSRIKKNTYKVVAHKVSKQVSSISVNESGTALRFLLPLLSLQNKNITVIGKGTLRGRPNQFLTQTLRERGVNIKGSGKKESIPIRINGGTFSGGNIQIDGTLSSQFISALLIATPQLNEDSRLRLKGSPLVSSDYITMTLQVLKKSGVKIKQKSPREFAIQANQRFKGLKNFIVPSDYGLAAFLMAAAALVKSDVTLTGHLNDELIQADGHILKLMKAIGVKYKKTSRSLKIKGPFKLKSGSFSLVDCPDLVPIMAVLALFGDGRTRLYNIKHARAKESDRISDLGKELRKVGARIEEKDNELIIYPLNTNKSNCILDPHNDHRLAMAFSVLGLKIGVKIKDIECCKKSYPGFIKDFKTLLGA